MNFYGNRSVWGGNGQGEDNNNLPTKTEMTAPEGRRETSFNAYWRMYSKDLAPELENDYQAYCAAERAKGNVPILDAPFKNQWLSRRLKAASEETRQTVEAGRLNGKRGKDGKFASMADVSDDLTEDKRLEAAQKYQK
jgi:hypothetical protein